MATKKTATKKDWKTPVVVQSKETEEVMETTQTTEVPQTEKIQTEETQTEDSLPITDKALPKRYYVKFWKRVQPSDPRFDEIAGTIYWSDVKQDIIVEGLDNKYSADIEAMFGNDLKLPHGVFVSYAETPKEWVRNLHLAERANNFYAVQFMETIDETK